MTAIMKPILNPMDRGAFPNAIRKSTRAACLRGTLAMIAGATLACSLHAQSLLFQFNFDEARTGSSFTTLNTLGTITLNMTNGAAIPAPLDLHGLPNSGVAMIGRALDLTTNTTQPTGGTGPIVADVDDSNLGFGTLNTFTMTVWVKLDSLIVSPGNLSPQFLIYGPSGTTAGGNPNSIAMKLNDTSHVRYTLNNGTTLNVDVSGTYTTNIWYYFAFVYDGANIMVYRGNEAQPASLVSTTPASGYGLTIGTLGDLYLGNRGDRLRSMDGQLDDLRLYNGAATLSFVEAVRSQAAPTPIIGNFYPNGLLEPTNKFRFTASSSTGINTNSGIHVTLLGTDSIGSVTNDITSQLVITGPTTNVTFTYTGLTSNTTYAASISVADTLGVIATTTANFDTYSPIYVWEAENWDFTNGMYISSPVVSTNSASSYYKLTGVSGVDETVLNFNAGNPHGWRPFDLQSTDIAADFTRQPYITAGIPDYQVGFFNSGNWLNYTRNFPSGTYYVYARMAEGGGTGTATLSLVTNGVGTSSQGVEQLGTFSFDGTGWAAFTYVPLGDASGNPIAVSLNGVNTVRLTSTTPAGVNVNFLMLMPAQTNLPTITQVYPDGSAFYQRTNKFVFTAGSQFFAIDNHNIQLTLNGTDVSSSLVFSGSSMSWNGSYSGLQPDTAYTAVIKVTDANGGMSRRVVRFDTFASTDFTWEAEDFDFNNGQFFNNPIISNFPEPGSYFQVGFYFGTPAVAGVDVTTIDTAGGELFDYRTAEPCGTATNQDIPRHQFSDANASDYYVGWWTAPQWINYTRVFPTNTYYIYARLAAASGNIFRLTNSLVTGGWGTSNQSSQVLGVFTGTGNGFQGWQWLQLLDTNDLPAKVFLAGTNTLKMTTGSSINANFYLVVPAPVVINPFSLTVTRTGPNVGVSFLTQNGFQYTVFYKNSLTDPTWTTLTSVPGDGSIKTVNDSSGGAARFYRVGAQ